MFCSINCTQGVPVGSAEGVIWDGDAHPFCCMHQHESAFFCNGTLYEVLCCARLGAAVSVTMFQWSTLYSLYWGSSLLDPRWWSVDCWMHHPTSALAVDVLC